ncbi:phage antitermination protein Q [Klebsiella grimontii]|nr:phage antitermination protein Q [Klebsiella grimontii]
MSRDVIERIRDRWIKLRLLRSSGTVLVDYRIPQEFRSHLSEPGRDSMINTQYLQYVRQQLIVATADLSGATKGQLGSLCRERAIHRYGAQPGKEESL